MYCSRLWIIFWKYFIGQILYLEYNIIFSIRPTYAYSTGYLHSRFFSFPFVIFAHATDCLALHSAQLPDFINYIEVFFLKSIFICLTICKIYWVTKKGNHLYFFIVKTLVYQISKKWWYIWKPQYIRNFTCFGDFFHKIL